MRRTARMVSSNGMTDSTDNRIVDKDAITNDILETGYQTDLEHTVTTKEQVNSTMNDDVSRIIETEFDPSRSRYPFCIVWTPLPFITWLIPIIGHMGIAYSSGVIRDFAGPYYVSEDHMSFGEPTKYWVLDPRLAQGGPTGWDRSIYEASEEYKTHMHNIFCDNCHSHCAYALNLMNYKGSKSWNMIWLFWFMVLYGKYVSFSAFLKTWVPFMVLATLVIVLSLWKF